MNTCEAKKTTITTRPFAFSEASSMYHGRGLSPSLSVYGFDWYLMKLLLLLLLLLVSSVFCLPFFVARRDDDDDDGDAFVLPV